MTYRTIVAQPRPSRGAQPLPVGVVRFSADGLRLGVIVKTTLACQGDEPGGVERLELARGQLPLSLDRPSALPGAAPGELAYPSDLVPPKRAVDVVVTGHAYALLPAAHIDAALRAGGLARAFSVSAASAAERIPLSSAYLRVAAPASQRVARLEADAVLELDGLSPGGGRCALALPGIRPRAVVEAEHDDVVELACDTLWIDTDTTTVVLVWRGEVPLAGPRAAKRIVVWIDRPGEPRTAAEVHRSLARGRFSFAVEQEDLAGKVEPPDPALLTMARYEAWSETPEPTISLEAYAVLSATLAEKRGDRAELLARHDLDEDGWVVEERAWLERMAEAAGRGDGSLAEAYGTSFVATQDGLADPSEAARSLDDYAALKVAVEHAKDPSKALVERGMSVSAWMRLDRRFSEAASRDPALAAELRRRLSALEAELPPEESP